MWGQRGGGQGTQPHSVPSPQGIAAGDRQPELLQEHPLCPPSLPLGPARPRPQTLHLALGVQQEQQEGK